MSWKKELLRTLSYGELNAYTPLRVTDKKPREAEQEGMFTYQLEDLEGNLYDLSTYPATVKRMLLQEGKDGFFLADEDNVFTAYK